ncbi:hypothetical protein BST96_10920 [Oceanicoccus sagamiensis]|uniref:Uncharacterized protein n=2 Tax=Oceanicoccus sagamiensis TaxID=716816 RepID=A0A1X9NGU0_9GAMM|nr:hypothetical protein BST96_10920 [Oceanicoccus sagamiensis]
MITSSGKILQAALLLSVALTANAAGMYKKVERDYVTAPNAPASQSQAEVDQKSNSCISCHTDSDSKTMHTNPGVKLGCTDCHGGNTSVFRPDGSENGQEPYLAAMSEAHILPQVPDKWPTPSSRNPERTYTLLNHESPEFIRFINPSDYRIVNEACGACHQATIEASIRSLHSTGAMLWGGASYNNGILPNKNYFLGESYTRDGKAQLIKGPVIPDEFKQAAADKGVIEALYPLPAWETIKPGDIFRVFERGGRNITNLFPETGLPSNLGQIQRLEEPGRPDIKQSNRGPGTGGRISVPVINITKTRLNDPFTWFIGTNDQPGDYRNSGCASCHVVYANDRDPRHSGPYAQFGHDGQSITKDPTIDKEEKGHPLQHTFTRAIPTSQCMICHMHQPNMFMNTFLGYTMWDYESDAPQMWPEQQQYPSHKETRDVLDRNPEGAAPRGKWADVEFLKKVWDNNDKMQDTQFADYHGHGWNFRAIFKRDRKGNLLDAEGAKVADDDPKKFEKAVHMSSIHVDVGMHCVDCHFSQDNHGNGHIYGEVALAVEVDCKDCHGTSKEYPNLYTSGPAALEGGADLSLLRTPDGRRRFEWIDGELFQRSSLYPDKEWKLSLVKDSVTEGHAEYNKKAARAKLMSKDTDKQNWGEDVPAEDLAHSYDDMECYTCHTSWTTSCGGCHLPIEANWKTERHHYEGGESRNYATYNPQVARDQIFMLGRRGPAKGGKIAPTRSTSALVLSSTNSNREKIYIQQPPIASSGYSSQAFNPHFPHTVRKTETKTCSDCHVSKDNDNNAIMAQLLMQGTNFINFVGYNAWLGGDGEISAVQVTEWDEPQAVIGSYLHKYAYPDWYQDHLDNLMVLQKVHKHSAGTANCLQLRGEYLYVAEGSDGMQVYDVASIANKGISQRIITAPFSALGHDAHISSENATCVALPSNQPIAPAQNQGDLMRIDNQEQPFHPIYTYAVITDAVEGLILVNIDTFMDGEPRNNFLERALTWNEGGVLDGARHVTVGGHYLYITTDTGVVIVDVDNPLEPSVTATIPMTGAQATAIQFRYLFVTDSEGLKVVDISNIQQPLMIANNTIAINNAYKMHLARTYAYVAAGDEGVVIVDITQPEAMQEYQRFNADGELKDSRDVIVATTNASLIGYVADGSGGLKVLQLTSPESQPKFYGFSPDPKPQLIAKYATGKPALSLSRPLERDRGVDETGGQISVFGRRGSRPFNKQEMEKMYLNGDGKPWFVED